MTDSYQYDAWLVAIRRLPFLIPPSIATSHITRINDSPSIQHSLLMDWEGGQQTHHVSPKEEELSSGTRE